MSELLSWKSHKQFDFMLFCVIFSLIFVCYVLLVAYLCLFVSMQVFIVCKYLCLQVFIAAFWVSVLLNELLQSRLFCLSTYKIKILN